MSSKSASSGLVLLLAAGAGVSVASLYYNQPILGAIAKDLDTAPSAVGLLPTLTQIGYGSGILLFAPLGDRFDRIALLIIVKNHVNAIACNNAVACSLFELQTTAQ